MLLAKSAMPSKRLGLDGVRSSSTLRIFFMGTHYNRPHEKTQVQMKDYKYLRFRENRTETDSYCTIVS